MKRLLDRVLSRWYTPNAFFDAMEGAYYRLLDKQMAAADAEARQYVQLRPGVYWPVPETRSVTKGMRCS